MSIELHPALAICGHLISPAPEDEEDGRRPRTDRRGEAGGRPDGKREEGKKGGIADENGLGQLDRRWENRTAASQVKWDLEFNSDGRAGDVRFRSIPTPTPTGGSSVLGMVAQGVSKYCIFNEDFRYVFKSAIGAVVYELR